MRSFLIVQDMCKRRRRSFLAPYPWAAPKRSILNRVKTCNFIKKRLQRRCFPVNIPKFSRAPILKKKGEQLLNKIWKLYWKYACELLKKDLATQEAPFKFFKTYKNFSWNFRFIQYSYWLDLLKVCKIFSIQSCKACL